VSSWSPVRLGARALVAACAIALVGPRAASADEVPATPPAIPTPTATATATSTPTATATATPTAAATATATAADPDAPSTEIPPVELPSQVVRLAPAEATKDPTAAVTVIPVDRFAGEAKSVAALVATSPGVAVQQYGGLGQLSTVSIRGSASSGVLVMVDGLPINTATGTGVDLSSVPRHWIERIEVLRGAEGAHYGAGALGGVVNLVTRGPGAGGWSAEATAGSFGTWAAAAEAARDAGQGTLMLSASAEGSGGGFAYAFDPEPNVPSNPTSMEERDNNATARGGLLVRWARPGARRVDALLQLSGGRRELPGWPTNLTPGDRQADARALASIRLATAGPARTTLATRASFRGDLLDVHGEVVGGGTTRQRGGAASVESELRLPHARGVATALVFAEGETIGGAAPARTRGSFAAALSDDLEPVGWLRVAPALRVDRVGEATGVSGKLGASARAFGPVGLRASVGRSFRPPGFAELYLEQGLVQPNPALRPEVGTGGDVALVLEGARVLASAGAHATVYDDLIFYQQTIGGRLKPFNSGKALVRGLEGELATPPARRLLGLALSASYTWLHTEVLRGSAAVLGNEIPHRAPHRLFARAAIGADRTLGAFVELHHVGRQFSDQANDHTIAAARIWNAGASLRFSRRPAVSLHLAVENLADDRTQVDGFGNPLPGRTVLVTVRAARSKGTP
jgi:iron complex outermembrane receptor protein